MITMTTTEMTKRDNNDGHNRLTKTIRWQSLTTTTTMITETDNGNDRDDKD